MASESVDISEEQNGQRKIVRHTFYGRDKKEARHNLRAHRKSDKFFDAALKKRPYKGIKVIARKVGGRNMRRKSKRSSKRY